MMIAKRKYQKERKNVIKIDLMCKNYKHCLFNDKIILKSQQRFKSNCHNICTEQNQ